MSQNTCSAGNNNFLHCVLFWHLEYVRGVAHTNTIEGFWGNLKNSIGGTYHAVSPKYLQQYVNQFVFMYNYRTIPVCPVLLERAAKLS